ncbi:ras-related protein Rab-26 isoform X3 [Eurosta solidaginis]|uniref:ras-related protein Rab-26 isoform X3 n=1 Tax=Eurosta solidaginis TaxID=178769 RepID=UPI0035315D5D
MSHIPDDASSMSDDVFEDPETTQRRFEETVHYRTDFSGGSIGGGVGGSGLNTSVSVSCNNAYSTGYPGYRPPVKALQIYALEDAVFHDVGDDDKYEDGWRSYRYDEVGMYNQPQQQPFDDTINHKNKVVVVDGTRVKLQIWDTAGQERFRSVTHAYYRDAHALLLLYDVTNKTTYDNIRAWLGEIREYAQDDVVIVLIGNKADCSNSERQVKREDGERLSREHNVPFMETSAKTGLNVELAFSAIARQLKCRGTVNGDDGKFNVHDFVRDNTRARTMCAQCKAM